MFEANSYASQFKEKSFRVTLLPWSIPLQQSTAHLFSVAVPILDLSISPLAMPCAYRGLISVAAEKLKSIRTYNVLPVT